MRLNQLTIKDARVKLDQGEISSADLTKSCLERIDSVNGRLNACLTVCKNKALTAALAADKRINQGESGGLLGIPYLAKDNIMTRGIKTTAASKMLENYIAPYDAAIIIKLKKAGAVLLGKTNLDEFAHGASTENSFFGPTRNPCDLSRVPGGSSGGSAAAVAADMCLFALGTDTGGSIRHPASFCGVTGLKPTYGRASRFGLIAMTSSTDVPGPLAKTAEDASFILKVIAGNDSRDVTTADEKFDYKALPNNKINGLKIGLPKEYYNLGGMDGGVSKVLNAAINKFKEMGAECVEVNLPHTKYAVPAYYVITPSEISSNLARYDGLRYGFNSKSTDGELIDIYKNNRGLGFGPETKRRIMLGTYALSAGYFDAYYLRAQKVRTKIIEEFDSALMSLDLLLTPATPHTAFKIGEQKDDPLKMYLEDIFMVGASLAGLPAISIPAGFANNLPVGLQLIGKRFDEAAILSAGQAYQGVTDWHKSKPNI